MVSPYGMSCSAAHTVRWNGDPSRVSARSKLVSSPSKYASSWRAAAARTGSESRSSAAPSVAASGSYRVISMCMPASRPSAAISVSGPIGLAITVCDRRPAPGRSADPWCPASTVRTVIVVFPFAPPAASCRRQVIDGVVGGGPQVLHGVRPPRPPPLGPLDQRGWGGGGGGQAGRGGRLLHAQVGGREGIGVTEAAHRHDLDGPLADARHGRERAPRELPVGPRAEVERARGHRP